MRPLDPRLMLTLLAALALGCGGSTSDTTGGAGATTDGAATTQGGGVDDIIPSLSGVVAKVNGQDITYAELDEKAASKLVRLKTQAYEIRKGTLDELIDTRLTEAEATKRSLTVDALIKLEVTDKIPAVTEEAAREFFEKNPPRGAVDFDRMKDRIKDYLGKKNEQDARTAFIASLRSAAGVEVFLEPMRFDVKFTSADPVKGAAAAPIQIIEYSDFQCPYCTRVNPTLAEVQAKYGDKVAIAFRNYPLPMHADAPRAGEASYCAQDQGKFWEYHDVLFQNQQAQKDEQLKKYAVDLGLDAAKFDACLAENTHKARVEADRASGDAVGVSGTPAFFINGVFINGARPIESFADVIDAEIKLKKL